MHRKLVIPKFHNHLVDGFGTYRMNYLKSLPNELKLEILKFLPFEQLVSLDNVLAKKKYNPKIHTIDLASEYGH